MNMQSRGSGGLNPVPGYGLTFEVWPPEEAARDEGAGMPEVPIMCTLPPDGLVRRLADFEAVFAAALTGFEREPLRLRLTFDADAATETAIRDLIAAEQRCCAFLAFAAERRATALVVEVTAPPGAGPTLDGLQALAERAAPPDVVARRWTS